ncbi:MAG: GAF domain-containing protein [Deltaproteobacteria bacterium]|nr:GAF domain-containing protein [Deltaproteobacteria bacterium]
MGYDILSKVIELTDSTEALEKRLKDVAYLLIHSFAFDQCAIYLLDQDKKVLTLAVAVGSKRGCQEEYREDEGLPGLAIKNGKPIFATQSKSAKELWQGGLDKGTNGFNTIVCYPIKDDWFHGVLYLKNKEKKTISIKQKRLLGVITLQLATAIKNYQCIVNLRDINTKMKDMQYRLVNAEKLLALGEMAASLAHEIKNPLVSIGGFAKRLSHQMSLDSPYMSYVDRIVKEVAKLEKLMDGIVHFSKEEGYAFSSEDINSIIEETIAFFEDDFKKNEITVIKELSLNVPKIDVDRQHLNLVFNNLMTNAIQAMEKGGRLTIQTYQEGNWIVAEIHDTGGGIDPKIMSNIFNPFYTTKETGTGLGLAITHSIITNHKGIIEVNNNIGVGVTFIIKLPLAGKEGRILEAS